MKLKTKTGLQMIRLPLLFLLVAVFALGFNFLRFFIPDQSHDTYTSIKSEQSSGFQVSDSRSYKIFPSRRQLLTDTRPDENKTHFSPEPVENNGLNTILLFSLFRFYEQTNSRLFNYLSFNKVKEEFSSSILCRHCLFLI